MSYDCNYTVDQMLHGPHMPCGCLSSDQHVGADSAECLREERLEHMVRIAELQFENRNFGENHPLPSFEAAMAQKALYLGFSAISYLRRDRLTLTTRDADIQLEPPLDRWPL